VSKKEGRKERKKERKKEMAYLVLVGVGRARELAQAGQLRQPRRQLGTGARRRRAPKTTTKSIPARHFLRKQTNKQTSRFAIRRHRVPSSSIVSISRHLQPIWVQETLETDSSSSAVISLESIGIVSQTSP